MSFLIEPGNRLDRFRRGEPRILEEVYRHYLGSLRAFLRRGFSFRSDERVFSFRGFTQPFDLENALQETFARAFKESARLAYDGQRPYKAYLFATARNLVLDQLRSQELAMSVFVEEDAAQLQRPGAQAGGHSAEEEYLRRELGRLCAAFVATLSERERRFFCLRFEEERTQLETGALLGLSYMQARTLEKKLQRGMLGFMQANGYLASTSL